MKNNIIEEFLEEKLFSDETKDLLVKKMNEAIDIPFIGEKTEAKALNALVSVIFGVFRKALNLEPKEEE